MGTDRSFGVVPVRQVDGGRHYLLVRHNAGHWAFPKGHAEAGETPLASARRELAEETGLVDVDIVEEPGGAAVSFEEHYRFSDRSGEEIDKTVVYFLGRAPAGSEVTVQIEELSDSAWGSYAESRERLTFDEGRALLDRVEQWLARQSA